MAKQMASEGTVRVGSTISIPTLLRSLGADPAAVYAEAGIDLGLFDDPDNVMPFAARIHLLNLCAAKTGCRHFGLLVGEQVGLHSFGLVGFLVQHSPDVGTALQKLVRHLHLHVRGAAPTLEVYGHRASFGYEIHQPCAESVEQLEDAVIASGFNMMRTLCGPDWLPDEVLFAHTKPQESGLLSRFFRAPVRFGAGQNTLVFRADWLNRPLSAADPELRRLLQKEIDSLEAKHSEDFPEQVRSVLRTALLTDHAGADQVAKLFSMHSRTLSRRLSANGTSFQKLTDECRFEIARTMLEDSKSGMSEIAAALEYADASAFTRAFRRWSGTTPGHWRDHRNMASAEREVVRTQ